ncbi:MAG: glycosyltransferase [Arenicellales bacterium]
MEISVVIPTWNRVDLVRRALNSVLNQTLAPAEVIVVDDGSDDNTIERVARDFPEAVVLTQTNQGVSSARNRGIRIATGEWIALLDSDDEWLPGKLAAQAKLLSFRTNLDVCHTDELWIRDGRRVNPKQKHSKPEGWIFDSCLPLCCVSPSSILMRRSIFDKVGWFDETLPTCEDYDMWLRVFCEYEVGLVESPMLIKYGGHDDQLSRRYWGMDRFRVRALEKILQSGRLNQHQTQACIDTLDQKCNVLISGFEKRGKNREADQYREIKDKRYGTARKC